VLTQSILQNFVKFRTTYIHLYATAIDRLLMQ